MLIYALDINGQPLMPTSRCGKVRRLLKTNKAKVIKRCPFTIQLNYETTNHKQEITPIHTRNTTTDTMYYKDGDYTLTFFYDSETKEIVQIIYKIND